MNRKVQQGASLPPRSVQFTARHITLGAMASRDWQPQHHDHDHARAASLPGIILNTPAQTQWFIGYATEWTGPEARPARWRLGMKAPVSPGEAVTFTGVVEAVKTGVAGHEWVVFNLAMMRGEEAVSTFRLMCAVGEGVWQLSGANWQPPAFEALLG